VAAGGILEKAKTILPLYIVAVSVSLTCAASPDPPRSPSALQTLVNRHRVSHHVAAQDSVAI
jgi:hypothetical protein